MKNFKTKLLRGRDKNPLVKRKRSFVIKMKFFKEKEVSKIKSLSQIR